MKYMTRGLLFGFRPLFFTETIASKTVRTDRAFPLLTVNAMYFGYGLFGAVNCPS